MKNMTEEIAALIKSTGEFVIEQSPSFVKEFLEWEFFFHGASAGIELALIIIIYFAHFKIRKTAGYEKTLLVKGDCEGEFMLFLCFWAVNFMLITFLMTDLFAMAKIKHAPKVYLVENLSKVIK